MAEPIIIKIGLATGDVNAAAQDVKRKLASALADGAEQGGQEVRRKVKSALDAGTSDAQSAGVSIGKAIAAGFGFGFGEGAIKSIIGAFRDVASAAIESAVNIDKSRQTIAALVGSTEAANRKLRELRELASKTPGLTASLASDAFGQLKASAGLADDSINKFLKSFGRLNAVFNIEDSKGFIRNLTQIFTQGFERADVKEAIGRVPIFEQILQNAFGTKDPDKLRKLKESGKLTIDQYFAGLSEAIGNDARFANVRESLGVRFEKTKDTILTALAPLGDQLSDLLIPALQKISEILSGSSEGIADLARNFKLLGGAVSAVISPVEALYQSLNKLLGGALPGNLSSLVSLLVRAAGALPFGAVGGLIASAQQADDARRADIRARLGRVLSPGQQTDLLNFISNKPGPPKPDFSSSKTKDGSDGAAAARQLRTAELARERSDLENQAKIIKDINDRGLRELQDNLEAGRISTKEYYEFRLNLATDTLQTELNLLREQEKEIRSQIAVAKGAERIKLEERLGDVLTQELLKLKAIGDASTDNLRNFKKALGPLTGPNLDLQEQVKPQDPQIIIDARQKLLDLQRQGTQFDQLDSELRVREIEIQNAINAGVLNEVDGKKVLLATQREYRDQIIAALEAQRELAEINGDLRQVGRINEQIATFQALGVELSNTQRFLRGIGSETEGIGDIFERFGRNVANSFRSIKGVFDGLKNAVKSFFADLLGNSLQGLLRQTLGALFGGGGAAGGRAGGAIGGLGAAFGGLFGGGAATGGGFLTGGFAGGGGAASILGGGGGGGGLGSLLGGLFGGGGLSAPGSLSLPSIARPTVFNPGPSNTPLGRIGGGGLGSILGGLGNLFKGIGFGKAPGSGGALAGALPLLGLSLGAGLGGSSLLGNLLGGAGGALLGIGLTAAPAGLAGGALGFLAPLFSNPITAIVGGALLPLAFLLGRSKQRAKDEATSGDYLQQAVDAIRELKSRAESGQVTAAQARQIFDSQILGQFIQQINTIKTKSVRESRLKNQVADLRALFEKEVIPAAAAAKARGAISDKLVPEFATGGIVPGFDRGFDSVRALVRPGEMILTRQQQAAIQAMTGPGVFSAIGVPGAGQQVGDAQAFAAGGVARAAGPMEIVLDVQIGLSETDARQITVRGAQSADGQQLIVRTIQQARKNGEV